MQDIRKHWTAVSNLRGGDRVLSKVYGCNLQDTFRLIGRAITMTS